MVSKMIISSLLEYLQNKFSDLIVMNSSYQGRILILNRQNANCIRISIENGISADNIEEFYFDTCCPNFLVDIENLLKCL